MEEDSGVKAPVTRLRRRLSVEQSEDVKSPAPATPTKKRGGRLAAKPQLELIDEHAADITPSKRTTRKASAKEIVEAAEEKTVTPSRRSTRIKSNTSIVSETTQSYDSPRAKRAARRTSQVGSDSESSATPVRQTRRTRKDSTSSIDKLEVTLAGKPHITEVIIEEENMSVKSDDSARASENLTATSVRKSPRLREKKERGSIDIAESGKVDSPVKDQLDVSTTSNKKGRKSLEQLGESSNENYETTISGDSKESRIDIPGNGKVGSPVKDQLDVSQTSKKKDRKSIEQFSENINESDETTISEDSKKSRKKGRLSKEMPDNEVSHDNTTDNELNVSKRRRKSQNSSLVKFSSDNEIQNENISEETVKNKRKSLEPSGNVIENDSASSNGINLNNSKQLKERKSVGKHDYEVQVRIDSPEDKANDSALISKCDSAQETNNILDKETPQDNLSDSSILMIKELDKKPKKKSSIINKSTSSLDDRNDFQNKRQRTKSWTITSLTHENDGMFYSDNETTKKKALKRNAKELKRQSNHNGSGDSENDKSLKQNKEEKLELDSSYKSNKDRKSTEFMTPKKSVNNTETISPQGNKENILISSEESSEKFFAKTPTAILQSTVYFEDSDTDTKSKVTTIMQLDAEDQCVPVIDNKLVEDIPVKSDADNTILSQKNDNKNDSCEPMDIDETIPNNVSIVDLSPSKLNKSSDSKKIQSVQCSPVINDSVNKSSNKSKRKSSLSTTQNFEKSETENKSTLILSQLKDVSATEHNVSKTPKLSNEIMSNSVGSTDNMKEKKNVTKDYSTSTPLQQKKFQKLGMQINSSIIDSSNIETKKENERNTSKNNSSRQTKSSSEEDSDEVDEDEESSSEAKSQFLDDEADVASDDYESGDSRDTEEREYEDENEIVEKGETLDSEDDVSDDTDYEKDSFVVSSDEEDNELLSGSGDDLSLSDNELSMSKKSKKKYNERKQKEQKKASREMYEARHKLDDSDVASKPVKKKKQQIESSEDSEEEVIAPIKRNNKLRLDSTHDDEMDKSNASLTKKKNKSKRLSESICDESAIQEQEINTNETNVTLGVDPLSVQVKLEPKTPMKDMNLSTIQINENIEEVEVDNNVSILKSNEDRDPLQATMLGAEDSSMSENSEIMNNYDSVLNDLNNVKSKKTVKSLDMSLNLDKKTKKSLKEPIIDQLNLTKTKSNKKSENKKVLNDSKLNKSKGKGTLNATVVDDESASDSIDLQLLFSEDSNDYDDVQNKSIKSNKTEDNEDVNDFIPLKRTPGKTNILSSRESESSEIQTIQKESAKKKNKKRKSQGPEEEIKEDVDDNQVDNDIQIFVDTQGTHDTTAEPANISLTSSAKKKKNKNSTIPPENHEVSKLEDDDEAPEEVSFKSEKNKKKNRKSSETHTEAPEDDIQKSDHNTSSSLNIEKKKKKRISESNIAQADDVALEMDHNISVGSSKKQKGADMSQIISEAEGHETSFNVSLKSGDSKKKKKKLSETIVVEETGTKAEADLTLNVSLGSSKKKKQKLSESSYTQTEVSDEKKVDRSVTIGSAKKQKSSKEISQVTEPLSEATKTNIEEDLSCSKKRKRKSSVNDDAVKDDLRNTSNVSHTLNDSLATGSKKKKIKITQNEENDVILQDAVSKKKNKKRKARDDDDANSVSKIFKENSYDKVHITRLPSSILTQLEDKPKKEVLESKKSSLVSTTAFIVEETRKRRNKPSKFLEESVYLNDTHIEQKQKGQLKKPKVLPFIPTAVTSGSGFTTNFKINVIPQEVQFVAQSKNVANFKNEYLYGKKIKRLGTYETYKKHRSTKMSKF